MDPHWESHVDKPTLKADAWYKAVFGLGGLIVLGAVFAPALANRGEILILGAGVTLVGIGEWMNHPFTARYVQTPAGLGLAQGYSRKNCVMGVLLDLVGGAALAFGFLILLAAQR